MADAEQPVPPAVHAVPRQLRLICAVVAAVIVVVMVVVGLLLTSSSTGVVSFHTSDQIAMIVLGLVLGAGVLALGRPRVDADAEGVRIRNILGSYDLPWEMIRGVRFGRNEQWASLELANGDEIAVLGLQAGDGERAAAAVEGLRALLAAKTPAPVQEPPRLYYD
jgi:hypothetical protein